MYRIILLNHFRGLPELMDPINDNIRYAKLQKILQHSDPETTICVGNELVYYGGPKEDKKIGCIRSLAEDDGFRWVDYSDETLEEIINIISKPQNNTHNVLHEGINMTPENCIIILGGTNTAGCVLQNSNVCARRWVDKGYNVQFHLSMCADYQSAGINQADKNQMAFALMYNYIKENNLIDKIDVFY